VFFVALLFFRDILDPGFSFFRVTTYEEWNWIIEQPSSIPCETQIVAGISFLQTVLSVVIGLGYIKYYWRRHLHGLDFIIPIIGLLLYAPVFYHIKYVAEHYYLWMSLIPLEIASLILACLLLFARKRNETTRGRSH
jgi:hypothetical protein